MNAYMITIGDELLNGNTLDTNSVWLGKKLEDYRNFFSRNEIEKEVRESAKKYFKNAVQQIETLPPNHQIELKNFISMVQNRSS